MDICSARLLQISLVVNGIFACRFCITGKLGFARLSSSKTSFSFVEAIFIKLEWDGTDTAKSITLLAPLSASSFFTASISSVLPAITVCSGEFKFTASKNLAFLSANIFLMLSLSRPSTADILVLVSPLLSIMKVARNFINLNASFTLKPPAHKNADTSPRLCPAATFGIGHLCFFQI